MKIGIGNGAFPLDWSFDKIFEKAAEIGFDGIELWLGETGPLNTSVTDEELKEIKASADKHGIELYSIASGLGFGYSLADNDEAVREKSKGYIKQQLEIANALGCDTILVVPCVVTEEVDYETAYNRAFDAMNELKPYAEKLGVSIGLENVWNKIFLSPLELRDFIDKVGSDFVGSYFDVGNMILNGYAEQWIKILGSRIKKVHIKDFKRNTAGETGFVGLFDGDVNFPAVMSALKEIGYDGWLTAELSINPDYRWTCVENICRSMRAIANS